MKKADRKNMDRSLASVRSGLRLAERYAVNAPPGDAGPYLEAAVGNLVAIAHEHLEPRQAAELFRAIATDLVGHATRLRQQVLSAG